MENKKKVGILTFHASNNFGAILQCFALQESLKSLGYETYVIDYSLPFIKARYKLFKMHRFKEALKKLNIRRLVGCVYYYFVDRFIKKRLVKTMKFNHFRDEFLNLKGSCNEFEVPQDLDVYIIGSDQVWTLENHGDEKNPIYFGEFNHPHTSKLYGYAISSNILSINTIGKDRLRQISNNFEVLSFREQSLQKRIKEIADIESRVDIDPTLLVDASVYDKLIDDSWEKEKYIVLYSIRSEDVAVRNKVKIKAQRIAKELDCKIVDIISQNFGPCDFVSLFKYAQYVVTSSFHGTAFSLIFERPMCCITFNDGNDARYVDLLNSIDATDMLVDIEEEVEIRKFDYSVISANLNKLRSDSLRYLKTI